MNIKISILAMSYFAIALPGCLTAQTLYWGAAGSSNSWNTESNWYTDAAETLPSLAIPTGADDLIFNTTPDSTTATTITVSSNIAAQSLTFGNTATTTIQSNGSTARLLNIGAGGVTVNSGNGAATFGASGNTISVRFLTSQTWTNNSDSALNIRNNAAASDSASGPVVLTLNAVGTGAISNSGAYSDGAAGSLALIVDSNGTGSVSMANSLYSGGTTIKRGLLSTGGNAGTGDILLGDTSGASAARLNTSGTLTSNITVRAGSSGILSLTGSTGANYTGAILLNNNLSIGSVSSSGQSVAYSGVISGAGNITVGRVAAGSSNPTVTLSGANTYTGKTTIDSATVVVDSLNRVAGGSSSSSLGAPVTVENGTIKMSAVSASTLRYTGTGEATDRVIEAAGSATLEQAGSGHLEFESDITWSGTGGRTLTLRGGTEGTGEISGIISNIGGGSNTGVTKTDSGTWRLSGLNTYASTTSIAGGVLEATTLANQGVASSLGTGSASNLSFSGGTLRYVGTGDSTNRAMTIGALGATLDASGSGAINFSRTSAPSYGSSNVAISLTLTGTNADDNIYAANQNNNGSGAVSITKEGSGKWVMTGTSTFTGATTVNAGTLLVSGTLNSGSSVSVNGGIFNYTNGAALGNAVTVAGGNFKYNSSAAYAGALTFTSGTISGTGNLSNTALTIGAGQIMAPGNSTGAQSVGATTWANAGTFQFELNDALGTAGSTTAGWDLLNAATLDITAGVGQFNLEIISLDALQDAGLADNFNASNNYSWLFVDAGSTITGFSADKFVFNTSGFQNALNGSFSVSQGSGIDNDKLYLNYTAIPEPSSYAMLGMGLTALYFLRRKRKA